ncbi:phosphatidylglycerophosphatase A [Mucilaginibacter conchicola]|uniref:Phosphatidylglycerophosphatase A n=1 Tax=Mucilaginibacter conchicola TaxID=2303333 RepID=A0A372NXT7_9SPHI|nr:phosphatidylglycerophosphatase A [Mucilaginibacter conchicola]RFZ94681.1 phosphatidylglycerophosphatase A [Mucilaginibacter conchicola]
MNSTVNKLIASIFGIGYVKGGGTLAALVTCPFIYLLWLQPWAVNPIWLVLATVVVTLLGVYVGDKVEPFWGKDSYRVVIDEVSGMMVTMLFVPAHIYYLLIGFVLFRFFDIVKPLGIRKMEALKGGTGVMMDDVLAGVYGNIVLQVIVHFTKF